MEYGVLKGVLNRQGSNQAQAPFPEAVGPANAHGKPGRDARSQAEPVPEMRMRGATLLCSTSCSHRCCSLPHLSISNVLLVSWIRPGVRHADRRTGLPPVQGLPGPRLH